MGSNPRQGVVRQAPGSEKGKTAMMRLIKFLLLLGFVGFLGVVGFAYLGDLSPEQSDVIQPVTLDAN
jgi:hypothetical protein